MIFACSPRKGGNCDDVATIVRSVAKSGDMPHDAEIIRLRDYAVRPCEGCQRCSASQGRCPLRERDDAQRLFGMLRDASELVIVAPIYFYHLPAQFKALIDRSQILWSARQKDGGPAKAARKAHVILVAARKKGDRLFTGSLQTLRCWLSLFDRDLAEPLCLYGLDERGDLMRNDAARAALTSYARAIYP